MPDNQLDPLFAKVARKALKETLHVKKGEAVTVEAWDNGLAFAKHAVAEARAMGCTAILIYENEAAYVEGVRRAPKDSLGKMGKNEYNLLAGTDAYIFVPGQALGAYSKTLKPDELADSIRYNSSWYDAAAKARLRGARLTFGYVGKDLARLLGKKVEDVVRAQLKAALIDLAKIRDAEAKVSPLLADGGTAVLKSGQSTLRFRLKGELDKQDGIVDEDDLKANNNMAYLPPGLITKEVNPASANGRVTLTDALTKYGVMPQAELEFKGGVLVAGKSNDDRLQKLMDAVAPEKRRLTILGLGFNPALGFGYGQDRFVKGSLTLGGFGFTGLVKKGSLSVGRSTILDEGKFALST
jgi:leucyl aminopeptidase (aminopeptidase T)